MAEGTKRKAPTRRTAKEEAPKAVSIPQKPLRPAQCRAYMRRTLAQEFHGIVDGFVKGAKSGSCQHVKLATELLAPKPRTKQARSGKRTIARWLDEMERGG